MRKEELMVGDYVLFHDSGWASDGTKWHEDRVCRIIGIGDFPRLEWTDEDGEREEWPHASYGDIEPIPLTDDILKANGFYSEHNVGYVYEDDEYEIIVDSWNNCYRILYNRNVLMNISVFGGIAVHDLQHALRLAGISKEIIV